MVDPFTGKAYTLDHYDRLLNDMLIKINPKSIARPPQFSLERSSSAAKLNQPIKNQVISV
jgi:hypothetical protein